MKNVTGKHVPVQRDNANLEDEVSTLFIRLLRQQVKGEEESTRKLRRRTIAAARKALCANPSADLWIMLGDTYLSSRKSQECYLKALSIDPKNGEAAYELSKLAAQRGDLPRALTMIGKAIRSLPKDIEFLVMSFAADLYRQAGQQVLARKAKHEAEKYRKRLPKEPISQLDPDWHKKDDGRNE